MAAHEAGGHLVKSRKSLRSLQNMRWLLRLALPEVALTTEPIIHAKTWRWSPHALRIATIFTFMFLLLLSHRNLLLSLLGRAHHGRVGALRVRRSHEIHQELSVAVVPLRVWLVSFMPPRALARNSLMMTEEVLHELIWTGGLLLWPRSVQFLRRTSDGAVLAMHLLKWRRRCCCLLMSSSRVGRGRCEGRGSGRRGAHALNLELSDDVCKGLFFIWGGIGSPAGGRLKRT
jgi:hypothetical protein